MIRRPMIALLFTLAATAGAEMTHCPSDSSVGKLFGRGEASSAPVLARVAARRADPAPRILETPHFIVAYQVSGVHAVSGAAIDRDGNGHPDNIDSIASYAERVWRLAIDTMGYTAPKGLDSLPGYLIRAGRNRKFPIEVADLPTLVPDWQGGGYLGTAVRPHYDPDKLQGGELVIENDFLDGGRAIRVKVDPINTPSKTDSILYDYSKEPLKGWAATIAHEFYHSVSYMYDNAYLYAWHEMTATWFATRAFPQVKHHWQYLSAYVKNNSQGAFATFDDLAPYYNYPFVTNLVAVFGEKVLLDLWPLHLSKFKPSEAEWLTASLQTLRKSEAEANRQYTGEFIRLTANVAGMLNEQGSFVLNRQSALVGSAFKTSVVKLPSEFIATSPHSFGHIHVTLHRDQFRTGGNLGFETDGSDGTGAASILYLPSLKIESLNTPQDGDTTVFGAAPGDTGWIVVLLSGGAPGNGSMIDIHSTSSLPTSIAPRHLHALPSIDARRFDLFGRPVTSSTSGIVFESTPSGTWKRIVKVRE